MSHTQTVRHDKYQFSRPCLCHRQTDIKNDNSHVLVCVRDRQTPKMAIFTAVFSRLPNADFEQVRSCIERKTTVRV